MTTGLIITITIVIGVFNTLLLTKAKAEYVFFVAMALLCITGVLSFEEAFSGFDSSSVLIVGILYIIIAGLKHSGALVWIVRNVMGHPSNYILALLRLMIPVALLSSCMSNTATTALFQNVVKIWSERLNIRTSKLLIPLAYAATLGGLLTLIGTPPNLIVSSLYTQDTGKSMTLFAPFPVGIIILVLSILTIMLANKLIPNRISNNEENKGISLDIKPTSKTFVSIIIMVLMLIVSALNILPLYSCCLIAGLLMIILKCCSSDEAFNEVDWRVLIIFSGSVCIGKAISSCGADVIVSNWLATITGSNPYTALMAICGIVAIMTEFLSNTGCAALFYSIAYATAVKLDVSPIPFMIALMMSASSSYATPIATPPNLIVYKAGNLRFGDFFPLGIILKIINLIASVFVTTLFYPF